MRITPSTFRRGRAYGDATTDFLATLDPTKVGTATNTALNTILAEAFTTQLQPLVPQPVVVAPPAAEPMNLSKLSTMILVGSLGLLGVAVLLKGKKGRK